MNQVAQKISLILAATIWLSGCGPSGGFNVAGPLGSSDSPNGSSGISEPGVQFDPQDLTGTVSGGPTDGASLVVYDISEQAIEVRIPMAGFLTGIGLDVPIPKVPGGHAFMDNSNPLDPTLVVAVPAVYVLGKVGFDAGDLFKDPTKLPNGNPIPFTPGGEPPVISFLIPKINRTVQIYLGLNVIGVFVETPFNPMVDLTFPIHNKSKTETIGYFSSVRAVDPYNGGFFVSFNMPSRIAGLLDDYLGKVIVP
jgi:hypothetical protein